MKLLVFLFSWQLSLLAYSQISGKVTLGGNPLLQLKFNQGEVTEYTLQYVNEKTLLNGTRYFRTYDAPCQ